MRVTYAKECSVVNSSKGCLEDRAYYLPNLKGKGRGRKALLWEEHMSFFRKDKWVFRRTNRR